uniref:M1 family metallopeptidase n=2 Tax=Flavobacterium sp. TaxID=239 RepID=UPI00404A8A99
MKNKFLLLFLSISFTISSQNFTRRDSLQGGLRPERTCFDVLHYGLSLKVDIEAKSLSGHNTIKFKIVENTQKIQLDLFANMSVDSIVWQNQNLKYNRDFDAVFIDFPTTLIQNQIDSLTFFYHGKPVIAKNAPWDGGFVWKQDSAGKPFVGVAVQGTGSSLWFPAKDHQSDEPNEGATIQVAVPKGLMNVSNGRFMGSKEIENDYIRWDWEVKSPINNYNITINIADYVLITDNQTNLDVSYYVLRENETIARKHFEEVKPMMACFEEKFGAYPFAKDGYKLVETPYLGMEHQSAVAYGNKYKKGYLGSDFTGTGIGMLFDYITIHETAHEWFGNSVTSVDIADMWIHESFTTYAESVFVECEFGYEKSQAYINGQKRMVENRKPIVGQFGVNFKTGNSDMYYKGALMLNTFRHVLNDDKLWWDLLKKYSEKFRLQIIEKQDVVQFFNENTKVNFSPLFDQYLLHKKLPNLEIVLTDKGFSYRWITDVPNFEMPFEITIKDEKTRLLGTNEIQKHKVKKLQKSDIKINNTQFLINYEVR